jgi:anti-sigma factor RsiW
MSHLGKRIQFRRDHRWTPKKLSAYLDGELIQRSRRRLDRHVRDCPDCGAALRSLERLLRLMSRVPPPREPHAADITAAVRRRLCGAGASRDGVR